jgi:hypothetical protein
MFGLNKFKKIGTGPLQMDALISAHESTKGRDEKRKDNYVDYYNQALHQVDKFIQDPGQNIGELEQAAYNLIDALHLVKDKPEPYLLLAYIFFMMGDPGGAVKYLHVCTSINPKLAGISEIQDLISGKHKKDENSEKSSTSPVQVENINKAISNVQKIGPPLSIGKMNPDRKKT